MSSKNIFIILIVASVAILIGLNYGFYIPVEEEKEQVQKALRETINKFNTANRAMHELENIRAKLEKENQNLEQVKSKFIKKSELSTITFQMRDKTREHNLRLIDFTPAFKFYFADTSKVPVKALPFSVTVSGNFINIGKFIESWQNFNFYILPEEVQIAKMTNKSNNLEAIIAGRFYAWSNDKE